MKPEVDIVQHACATGWRTHKDVEKTAARAKALWTLMNLESARGTSEERLERAVRMLEEGGMSGATANRYAAALLSAWRIAHKSGLVKLPVPQFTWRKEGKGRDRVPSRQEVAVMLRSLRKDSQVAAWLARFLYRTGARLGEALLANTANVTVSRGHAAVRLHDSKSGHPRVVMVPPNYGLVRRHDGPGYFFPIVSSTFGHLWRQARERAGLGDWFVPHSLRHACATEMIRAGVPLVTVAKVLGHSSTRTTERYTHPTEGDVMDALNSR